MKPELPAAFEPEIIVRRVKDRHAAHHGGAWKIAYADFVTAMMAFFLLMWIIGATNEDQRKGIADYFTPTVIQMKNSGGSNGVLAGRSIQARDGIAAHPSATGKAPVARTGGDTSGPLDARTPVPRQANPAPGQARTADEERFRRVEQIVNARLAGDPTLKGLKGQIKFVRTRDGMRIDIVERADFSMFGLGTSGFTPAAARLVQTVAAAVAVVPNALTVRGHTDARPYDGSGANNWTLSSARADATRQLLTDSGIAPGRFRRIEGVAATDPFNPVDPLDPRNRRISMTLLFDEPPRGSI